MKPIYLGTIGEVGTSFIHTRARRTDCDTSREAARHAASLKAATERLQIRSAVMESQSGLTAREAALQTGIDYIETQRRISECGLVKTDQRRDGCAVWRAA